MRVGLVIYGSLDLVSGGFLYDRMVVRELRAAGVEVGIVSLPWKRYGAALAENLRPWPEALQGFDVILEDQLVHPAVFARRGSLRPPVVALVHNLTLRPGARGLPALIERQYFAGVRAAIAVCEATAADVRALAPGLPVVVARAGRDHCPAEPVERRYRGPLRLLFVGTVMPHKGLHRLLEAIAPLDGWTLDVVGSLTADPAYASSLRDPRVAWHGEQHGEALWSLYRQSDVFVLPSDREAYSLACLEALGFGLPVLVTARGGMGEMITGPEGLTLDPDDRPAWRAAVARLIADRVPLPGMSAAAHARYRAHPTWRQTAGCITGFLDSLLMTGPA